MIDALRPCAVHEAAHAVVASRLAILVVKVEIVSDADHPDGFTLADVAQAGLVDWFATLMAGRIAERTILGYEAAQRFHVGSDEEEIATAIARTTRTQQVTAMAEQKARRLVMAHRSSVWPVHCWTVRWPRVVRGKHSQSASAAMN